MSTPGTYLSCEFVQAFSPWSEENSSASSDNWGLELAFTLFLCICILFTNEHTDTGQRIFPTRKMRLAVAFLCLSFRT